MASCCCCWVERPGLLGQLILATVATHAARNSRAALGAVAGAGKGCCTVTFLDDVQALIKQIAAMVVTRDSRLYGMG